MYAGTTIQLTEKIMKTQSQLQPFIHRSKITLTKLQTAMGITTENGPRMEATRILLVENIEVNSILREDKYSHHIHDDSSPPIRQSVCESPL